MLDFICLSMPPVKSLEQTPFHTILLYFTGFDTNFILFQSEFYLVCTFLDVFAMISVVYFYFTNTTAWFSNLLDQKEWTVFYTMQFVQYVLIYVNMHVRNKIIVYNIYFCFSYILLYILLLFCNINNVFIFTRSFK